MWSYLSPDVLVTIVPETKIALTIGFYWVNFRFYLDFELSPKVREILAESILLSMIRHEMSPSDLINELSKIR